MLNDFTGADQVYIACGYTDLRKGIDGLARLVNNSEDAKITANGTIQTVEANVKTEIKGDVKVVGATGSADVKVNGSAVAKTDKPAAGGSSGGNSGSGGNSSTASKEITGAEVVILNVPYGEKTADEALAAIPTTVTLKLKGGSTTTTTVTNWKWGTNAAYDPKPSQPDSTPAVATVTIPSGYTYNGTLTAEAKVTVLPLDKAKLEAAKAAYMDLQNKQTDDEKEAATDKTKILIIDSTPDQITAGVRFATPKDWQPLDDAIKSVENQDRIGFASQSICDDTAKTLQAAIDDYIQNKVKVGTNKTTDAYILQKAKDVVSEDRNSDAPYSSYKQPLKLNYVYQFVRDYSLDGIYLTFEWEAQWKNQNETGNIGDYIKIGNVSGTGGTYSSGAKVIKEPNEPKEVQFVVTVKAPNNNREIGKLGENGEYPATIGAPISVSADQPDTLPQFTATNDAINATNATKFTGVVPITLNGADAIASVPDGCVTMDTSNSTTGNVNFRSIKVDKVEKSKTGLNVTVSVTTGSIGGVWDENSPYPFKEGILPNISIDTRKFQLKENTLGWYLPTDVLKLDDMTVDVLTPAFTKVEHADDPTTGKQTFTIHTQNMPENAKVEVALAKKDVGASNVENDNATIKKDATRGSDGKYSVTFDKNVFEANAEYFIWLRYGSSGSNWAYPDNIRPTYTPNRTTSGGGESGGNTTEGSQAGA